MGKELFTREASGLVRGMTGIDALIGNVLLANLIFGSFGLLLLTTAFEGASMIWAIIFATIAAFFLNIVYVLFGSTFPVSGGDYVYNSRTIHPLVGFAANVAVIAAAGGYIAIYGNWAMVSGIAAMLETMNSHKQSWYDRIGWDFGGATYYLHHRDCDDCDSIVRSLYWAET